MSALVHPNRCKVCGNAFTLADYPTKPPTKCPTKSGRLCERWDKASRTLLGLVYRIQTEPGYTTEQRAAWTYTARMLARELRGRTLVDGGDWGPVPE